MNKLFVLLLLTPILSFGQIKFKDIMKIKNQQAFEKLMFDKQFSTFETSDTSGIESLNYALNPITKDGGVVSTQFASYTPSISTFYFSFVRTGTSTNLYTGAVTEIGVVANDYDTILRKAKRKCDFVKMYKVGDNNFACYTCKDSDWGEVKYLGFSIIRGQGVITNFAYLD